MTEAPSGAAMAARPVSGKSGAKGSTIGASGPDPRPGANAGRIAWRAAWITIAVLATITIGLVVLASLSPVPPRSDNRSPSAQDQAEPAPAPSTVSETVIERLVERAVTEADTAAREVVDGQIDSLFAPVYAAVPAYAEFHYSVLGEYTELTEVALRTVSTRMEERLFAGFDGRLATLLAEVDTAFDTRFEASLDQGVLDALTEVGPGAALSEAHQIALDHTTARALAITPVEMVVASGAATLGAKAAGAISTALLKTIASKFALKGVAKPVTVGGGVAAGVLFGAWGGPIGAGVGGAIGGAVAWFTMDYVVIKIDEFFTRDEFESDLRDLIDAQKEELREQVLAALEAGRLEVAGQTIRDIRQAGQGAGPAAE